MTTERAPSDGAVNGTVSLPTLVERFTAISSEHEHLGAMLRQLGDLCAKLERAHETLAPDLSPARLIGELLAELSRHFAAEEADAYFGTIVRERPALLRWVEKLKTEHRAMLEVVEELRRLARDPVDWAKLPQPSRRLIAKLRAHERAETRVLQELYLRDEGASED